MLDEWEAYARGMKSTADHWANRKACCLPVCSGIDASQPPPLHAHTHTDCIYITGCRAPLWQWNVLWLRHGPKCKQHHKEMRFQVNIFPMSDKVGETLYNASVFKALEHVFPMVADLTLSVWEKIHRETANQLPFSSMIHCHVRLNVTLEFLCSLHRFCTPYINKTLF